MLDVGAIAAEAGQDRLAVVGRQAHLARQAEQAQGLVQTGRGRGPALGQGRALGLVALAELDVGAEAAVLEPDGLAGRGIHAQFAVAARGLAVLALGRGDRPGVAALRIVGAADEGAETAGLQAEPARAAGGADARIGPVRTRREDHRAERVVEGVEHLGDAQLADLAHGGLEVLPEVAQQLLVVEVAGRDLVELLFQGGGEIVLHVAAEELLEEGGDQAALVVRDEPVLVHVDVGAVAQHGQDRGVGGGAADAELLHLLDQAGFRIARRRLGEVLVGLGLQHLGRGAFRDGRQAAGVVGVILG